MVILQILNPDARGNKMQSNMTDQDWVNYLNYWEESFYGVEESIKHDAPVIIPNECPTPRKVKDGRMYMYHFIEMTTAKAKFFVTHIDEGKRGFWVPNVAILIENAHEVVVADWCELTEISFK